MASTTMSKHLYSRQNTLREVVVTSYEVLSDGHSIPVYEPVQQSTRVRPRKYKDILQKYKTTAELHTLLAKGYRVVKVEDYEVRFFAFFPIKTRHVRQA